MSPFQGEEWCYTFTELEYCCEIENALKNVIKNVVNAQHHSSYISSVKPGNPQWTIIIYNEIPRPYWPEEICSGWEENKDL